VRVPRRACSVYAPYCDLICGRSGIAIFFDSVSYTARLSGEAGGGGVIEHKMCFDFLYNFV
jgi:hypothetical protein